MPCEMCNSSLENARKTDQKKVKCLECNTKWLKRRDGWVTESSVLSNIVEGFILEAGFTRFPGKFMPFR